MLQTPKVFLLNASRPIFAVSVNVCSLSFQNLSMAPSKVVAEYAKSNRSMCKTCSEAIQSKTLRLGLVSRDMARRLDITKWHHLSCFPISSSNSDPKSITGFSSLKSGDQEALTKLFAGQDKSEEAGEATEDIQNEKQDTEGSGSKKRKLSTSDVNINFSVSDVKSTYKDAALLPKWKAFQTVIFLERDDGLQDSSKIAAFDFDGCLAKTAVNITGPNAWSLMYPVIPDKLQSLYNDGYKLVIFTNESNIDRWKNQRQKAVDSKIGRLNQFIEKVKVPIQVFIACGTGKSAKAGTKEADPFRKPKPGMWQLMEKHFNSGITIDMDQSFYVGDAAGRETDHSDADIRFAEANGLKFYLPEEYFDA
ncbi:polynucleotide 3'-phosphatase ZDP-like isoform X1 [Vicia villosa]|uniref:polynucleotide 3'-phosphatase ZDP-like isoform X1 n=2 Tax=Vicia villosa TaxID=3911 RepID=UPI00273C4336|nr:polynucleotide 3'-phosphatase ZDP-like isoform X1 [Vicia villosa]XP_058749931.1 polynucleotide 3'-phosphatase ZDP-like isoform X1 [Vicia villosa]